MRLSSKNVFESVFVKNMELMEDTITMYHVRRSDLQRKQRDLVQELENQYIQRIAYLLKQKSDILQTLQTRFHQELNRLDDILLVSERVNSFEFMQNDTDTVPPEIPVVELNDTDDETISALTEFDRPQSAYIEVKGEESDQIEIPKVEDEEPQSMALDGSHDETKHNDDDNRNREQTEHSEYRSDARNASVSSEITDDISLNRDTDTQHVITDDNAESNRSHSVQSTHRIGKRLRCSQRSTSTTSTDEPIQAQKRRKINEVRSGDDGIAELSYECEQCGKSFVALKDIKSHKTWHKTVRIIQPFVESHSAHESGGSECSKSENVATSPKFKKDNRQRVQNERVQGIPKIHSAETSKRTSNKHKTQTAKKEQRCQYCNQTFQKWQELEFHISDRHKEIVEKLLLRPDDQS